MDKLHTIYNELGHIALIITNHQATLDELNISSDKLTEAIELIYLYQDKLQEKIE